MYILVEFIIFLLLLTHTSSHQIRRQTCLQISLRKDAGVMVTTDRTLGSDSWLTDMVAEG